MPLHPPSANPAGPVMTRLWCHSAILDGQLKTIKNGLRITSSRHKPLTVSPALSSSSSPTPATLFQQSVKFKLGFPETDVITQVGHLPSRCLFLLVALLILISQPVMSKPWSNLQPDYVVFRSKICQPVSPTDLQKLMGPHFDKTRMASELANSKRNFDDPGNNGYQADEPRLGLAVDDAAFVEGGSEWDSDNKVFLDEREEDIYTESGMIEELDDKEFVERRTVIPGKKIQNKRAPQTRVRGVISGTSYRKNTDAANSDGIDYPSDAKRQSLFSDSYSYMRRRRRRSFDDSPTSYQPTNPEWDNPSIDEDIDRNVNINDYDDENIDDDADSKDKKSTDSIQLRLFLRGKDKKTRKLLKKKLRQKARNLTKPPPWECKYIPSHKRMRKGIFPDILLDGRCETDKCFYRLYNCDEIHYVLKLLERDPDKCNPLPSVSNITIYEERWSLRPHQVTVGCNCVSPNLKTNFSKSKPKNRQRGQF